MKITEVIQEAMVVMQVDGRVDTVTSPELQNAILLALQKKKNLILDFGAVDYVSSAGLRSLLMGHKTAISKGGSMTLTNVPEMVMEVFAMTGFDQVLQIK